MISPSLGADLAEPVADIYREAELSILARLTQLLAEGIDAPDWELRQLIRLQGLRQDILNTLAVTNPAAAELIQATLAEAYAAGELSAFQDAEDRVPRISPTEDARAAAVVKLAAETVRGVTSAQGAVLRAVDDVYRSVVAGVVSQVATGTIGRQAAVQRALVQFAGKGIASIETRAGRMSLPDYVTMAVRTASSRVALQGHLDTMDMAGLDLVVIHPGPRACSICDRWARAVLTRNRQAGTLQYENVATGQMVSVKIDATLDEARAAGWGHPNCRCALRTYLPGVTRRDIIQRPRWDREGYEAQQRQRGVERQIRGWKMREAISIAPEDKADARARVKSWQAARTDLLEQYPYLKRQSEREQIRA